MAYPHPGVKIIHFDKSNVNQISIITEDDSIIIKNEDKINQLWKITSHDLNGDNSQIDRIKNLAFYQ